MRLLRVRVEDFRGIDAYEVSFARDGVTIVEAPNEAGKTSLIEAVDLLLDKKDSSTAKPVRDVAPVGRDVGSFVEVEMRCGPYHLTCRKRFHRRTMTELEIHAPEPAQLAGDEAHDRLREILGDQVDMDLFEALWFRQGRSLNSVDLGSSSAVSSALDAEAGGTGDGTDDVLLERVHHEFERYYTPKGSDGKALREIDDAVEQATKRESELATLLRELEDDIEALARLDERIRDLQERREDLRPQIEEHRRMREEIRTARERVATRQAEAEGAQARSDIAAADLAARHDLVRRVQDLGGEVERSAAAVAPEQERLGELEQRLEGLAHAMREAQEGLAAARARLQEQQHTVDLLRRREEHDRLAARQERVERILQRAGEAEAFLDQCRLTDVILGDIRAADDDRRTAQAALDAGAPTVAIDVEQDLRLSVDGEVQNIAAPAHRTFTVGDRLRVDIPDLVEIEVRAGTSLADLRTAVDDAARRLADACERGGVADLDDAERVAEDRRGHEATVERCAADLETALEGLTRDELDGRLRVLAVQIAELQDRIGDAPEGADLDQAERTLDAMREVEAEAVTRVERARSERDALRDEVEALRERCTRKLAQLEGKREEHGRTRERLEAARDERDDDELARSVEEATGALEAAAQRLAVAESELDELDPETVELLADNAESQYSRTEEELRGAQDRRLQLRTRLDVAGEAGLGEQLAAARTELEHALTTQRRVRARAAAARMLHEELSAARDEAYRAYRAPLRDGITRLGRIVFGPSLDVTLDDELAVVQRSLDGTTLPWDSLSSGAREQLAVLTALAATELAAQSGVPLILDDTLGYTDPGRLERLGAVLSSVAGSQVIVLTCVAERYQSVGGAQVVRLRETRPASPDGRPDDTATRPDGVTLTAGTSAAAAVRSVGEQTPDGSADAGDRETLICASCGRDWSRPIKPGRKPSRCPECS